MATRKTQAATPGWVKAFLVAGVVLLTLGAIAGLSGHGPWQHGAAPAGHQSEAHQA